MCPHYAILPNFPQSTLVGRHRCHEDVPSTQAAPRRPVGSYESPFDPSAIVVPASVAAIWCNPACACDGLAAAAGYPAAERYLWSRRGATRSSGCSPISSRSSAWFFGFLSQGPTSLLVAFERDVDRALVRVAPAEPVADADLAHLPAPVQQYLRTAGVVGQPRVHNFRARLHGRIRNGPKRDGSRSPPSSATGIDEPTRLFYVTGSMFTIPVQGYHRYVGPSATTRVKAAALVSVVDVSGHEMNQGETVTMFNDMCGRRPR